MGKYIIALAVAVLTAYYAVILVRDLIRHKKEIFSEPGSSLLISCTAPIVLFLASMGVSDIVLNTLLFKKCNLVDDRRFPGTLIASGAIPLSVVAIVYLLSAEVDLRIVLTVAVCQALGASLGVRVVSGLNGAVIKKAVGAAMLLTAVFLVMKLLGIGGKGGNLTSFPLGKLIICGVCAFVFGSINMVGVGIKAPTMSLLLTLGLASGSVLPVIMTSCSFAAVFGGSQFVKRGLYQRKITLLDTLFGFIGVIAGIFLVINLNPTVLQIIMLVITVYAGIEMLLPRKKQ